MDNTNTNNLISRINNITNFFNHFYIKYKHQDNKITILQDTLYPIENITACKNTVLQDTLYPVEHIKATISRYFCKIKSSTPIGQKWKSSTPSRKESSQHQASHQPRNETIKYEINPTPTNTKKSNACKGNIGNTIISPLPTFVKPHTIIYACLFHMVKTFIKF
jgi:hypothetical protein